jgi:glycosyltransferase involved in cell wall biosynthesis
MFIPKTRFAGRKFVSRLKAILSRENADLVHVRSRVPAWIALPAAAALGIATVSTVHGRFIALSALKRIYNRKLLKTDHVIAISNYVKDLITRQYVDVEERLTVVHRGVDIDLFNPR